MRRFFLTLLLVLLSGVTALLTGIFPVSAYVSGSRWQTPDIHYHLDPANDARLGINNSAGIIQSASIKWSKASEFRLIRSNDPYDAALPTTVSTANFRLGSPCPDPIPNEMLVPAVVCRSFVQGTMISSKMYFNISPSWTWNSTGTLNCGSMPRKMDLLVAALHEFGHWYNLKDITAPQASVMSFDCAAPERELAEDDKRGATQLYGPRTSWEPAEAIGGVNTLTLRLNVRGYFNSTTPPPELGPRRREMNVTPIHGSWYEMMAGYATMARSYAYFQWFTYGDDTGPTQHYYKIRPNTKLRWYQYNFQQSTMGLDFVMSDGTTLRDSGLRDQNNVRVHPAARGVYPMGEWRYVEIDLTPLAGKTITHWMIAYDNGGNGIRGPFRAYFDHVAIIGQARDAALFPFDSAPLLTPPPHHP